MNRRDNTEPRSSLAAVAASILVGLFACSPAFGQMPKSPVVINIVGFHLFLAPAGLPLPVAVLAAELVAAWSWRAAFAPMLHARTPLPAAPPHAAAPTGRPAHAGA